MGPSNLDVTALAKKTWQLFIDKPIEHILAAFIMVILSAITLGLLFGPLSVGYIRMCEKQRNGGSIQLGDLFQGFDAFGSSLIALILYVVGVSIGMVLLVLPGAVLAIAWGFTLQFIALRQQGPIAALGSSWQLFRTQMSAVLTVILSIVVVSIVAGPSVILNFVTPPLCTLFATLAFAEMSPER